MCHIKSVKALEILDSRGNPTVKVFVRTEDGIIGSASVPSGASTGEHEAVELRDNDKKRYKGKGVLKAVENVNGPIAKILQGECIFNQTRVDQLMIEADGTENKSKFGANAILGASLAVARAAAQTAKAPLFRVLGGYVGTTLPTPMMNIINGGAHADNFLDFQEFMIRPSGIQLFKEKIRCGTEIFHTLKSLLKDAGHVVSVGDEGGFAPRLKTNEEALDFIMMAIEKAGYKPQTEVTIALDCAASEFYDKSSKRYIEKKSKGAGQKYAERTAEEQIDYLASLIEKYPIDSIEDPLDENDWEAWKLMTHKLGNKLQIVGDDIFVTNPKFLERGIKEKAANAILIKVNQIGTLTETLDTIRLAQKSNFKTVISHRSGETEDSTIADICVATNSGQIKTGSMSRSDRIAKYNRLLEIEEFWL